MSRTCLTAAGACLAAGLLAAPASASYMQTCSKLIAEWNACQETGGDCSAAQSAIEAECKCHALKGDDWKLVNAAVEKDDVCGQPPTTIIIPPPPEPKPPIIDQPPRGKGAGVGDAQEKRGDDRGPS